ncbi:hypothetical protein TGARI_247640 [Toxoplasma gondii ARI]|uniref:Uncharacterized protein n=1 Tax=Toxoplasma gondii ARI TaxID=1074872 RepID=A0A139YAY4_TOXGO|nr:hypothetical protein TGARI_247640 [Toxoplasma gondii ARI]
MATPLTHSIRNAGLQVYRHLALSALPWRSPLPTHAARSGDERTSHEGSNSVSSPLRSRHTCLWCDARWRPSPSGSLLSSPPREASLRELQMHSAEVRIHGREAGENFVSRVPAESAGEGPLAACRKGSCRDAAGDELEGGTGEKGTFWVGKEERVGTSTLLGFCELERDARARIRVLRQPHSSLSATLCASSASVSRNSDAPAEVPWSRVDSEKCLLSSSLSSSALGSGEARFFLAPSLSPFFSVRDGGGPVRAEGLKQQEMVQEQALMGVQTVEGEGTRKGEEKEGLRRQGKVKGDALTDMLFESEHAPKVEMECMNKKNRLALRKRRRRMGERVSLRYR